MKHTEYRIMSQEEFDAYLKSLEMELIKIKKIIIYSPGDETVGIFSDTWVIEHEVYVEPEDLEMFRRSLRAAWEYVADDAKIYFEYDGKSEFEL